MPIDIEHFEQGSTEELRGSGRTNAEVIISFLASRSEKAFTPVEIHDATGIPRGSVGVVLSRLEDRGLVRHRGEYWAIGDVDDVDTTLSFMATARAATDRLGPEDTEDWGPGVDQKPEDE